MESVCGMVAGIDVHKKTVVVVVLQSVQPDQDHASGIFGTTRFVFQELVAFLREHGVTYSRWRWNRLPSIGVPCGWR